jgi:hypothetical protein
VAATRMAVSSKAAAVAVGRPPERRVAASLTRSIAPVMRMVIRTPGRRDDAARKHDSETQRGGRSDQVFDGGHGDNSRLVRHPKHIARIMQRNGCDVILIVTDWLSRHDDVSGGKPKPRRKGQSPRHVELTSVSASWSKPGPRDANGNRSTPAPASHQRQKAGRPPDRAPESVQRSWRLGVKPRRSTRPWPEPTKPHPECRQPSLT